MEFGGEKSVSPQVTGYQFQQKLPGIILIFTKFCGHLGEGFPEDQAPYKKHQTEPAGFLRPGLSIQLT